MQTSRVTMARVIEPIGLLALLLRSTRTNPLLSTTTTTISTTAINNLTNGNQFRTLSSCPVTIKNGSLMFKFSDFFTSKMICSRYNSSSSSSSNTTTIVSKKSPKNPEKKKKASLIKKLHKTNKDLFGELLETQKEKTKRVKKETKQLKKKLVASSSKIKLLALESDTDDSRSKNIAKSRKKSSVKTPTSLPKSEPPVNLGMIEDGFTTGSVKNDRSQSRKAEIDWALKHNPKMTKIINRSSYQRSPPLVESSLPFGGDGQGEFVLVAQQSQNESLQHESRGATDATSSPEGDDAFAGEVSQLQQQQQLPSVKQFITSFYDCQDFEPKSESKVIKKPSSPTRKNSNPGLNSNDNNISTEAIEQHVESSSSSSFIDEIKEFESSHNTHYNNGSSSKGSVGIAVQTGQEEMTLVEDDHKKAEESLQENGNVKKEFSQNVTKNNHHPSSQMVKDGASDNVRNQKTLSSFIINVPYINPERRGLPSSAFLTEEKHLDLNPDSHEDDNNHNNNSINQPGQIISIPFPRIFYNKNMFEKNSINNNTRNKYQVAPNGDRKTDQNKKKQLPSVSKILNVTMPKEQAEALERWQAKMITEMGEEGFRLYKENMLNNGKMLHSNIESYLRGTPLDEISVADTISGHWSSMKDLLVGVQGVKVLESHVVHPKLMYCGIVDCVALFRNKLVVIDWKTSQKPKPFVSMTYDTPLQIAAYIGAINYDPNYSLKIDEGLIVIAYEDGKICQTFHLNSVDVAKYWKRWLERLGLYQKMTSQL